MANTIGEFLKKYGATTKHLTNLDDPIEQYSGMDASLWESFVEYGFVRNDETGKVFYRPPGVSQILETNISVYEVGEALEEASKRFFGYIGEDQDTALMNFDVSPNHYIHSLQQWERKFW